MAFVESDNHYNDLDPRIVMNSVGRPYMVWARTEPAGGAIYFSMFLATRWMPPARVSATGANGYQPNLSLTSDTRATVTYMTPTGPQTRILSITDTDSIPDDIAHKDTLHAQL